MLNLCIWIGNICNGLVLGNASIGRRLTCCKKLARHETSRKLWSTKFPLGGGGKPYLATGLRLARAPAVRLSDKIFSLGLAHLLFSIDQEKCARKCVMTKSMTLVYHRTLLIVQKRFCKVLRVLKVLAFLFYFEND